ncbi:alpha/beta fold hydrolase [uncultured Flavobacterium sp.]|uniref:alpha/beta fold hydrolase n=1 Tax=uncultured Flavobacterium sp. TaxID=165435 RepID=UPI00292EC918|nr:alpha/beta fold hydrolase [uncultured Flavobacterium sp.]
MAKTEETYQWIDRKEYPFKSKYIQSKHGKIHYLDEGSGQVLLFVHGNPNWSFGYRKLIQHFSKNYRCVAIDHIGFGLSEKPFKVSYLPPLLLPFRI